MKQNANIHRTRVRPALVALCRDMGNNERLIENTVGKLDMDADVDVGSHENIYDRKGAREKISKSGTSGKGDYRVKAEVAWTCKEERRTSERQAIRNMADGPVPGKIRRCSQKTRWKDSCNRDTESLRIEVEDRVTGQSDIYRNPKPFPRSQLKRKS